MLLLLVAPTISYPKQKANHFVVQGNMSSLHCSAKGFPIPFYSWIVGGKAVDPSPSRYSLQSNGTLLINRAELNDSGVYVCIARNLLGTAESSGQTVTVGSKSNDIYSLFYSVYPIDC